MENHISGLFTLAGVLLGGLFTLLASRMGHKWHQARRDISRLSEQLAAFYALEHEYVFTLYEVDPERGAPGHIKTMMRDRVQQTGGFDRPTMTSSEARDIAKRYS